MFLYKITNLIDGKIYIGLTKNKPQWRFAQHINGKNNSNSYLKKAIDKYGQSNFTFEVIAKANSLNELNELEVKAIEEFKSLAPNGYNLHTGGNRHQVSEITKEKQKISNKGKRTPEAIRKTADALRGRKVPRALVEQRAAKQRGIKRNTPTNARKVKAIDVITHIEYTYNSLMDAAKALNADISNISATCNGRLKSHKGYRWEYVS